MRDAVTVVVPTRDRPEQLRSCLEALAGSPIDGLEIVVVDDGSSRPLGDGSRCRVSGRRAGSTRRAKGLQRHGMRARGRRRGTSSCSWTTTASHRPAGHAELAAIVSREARLVVAGRVRVPADAGVWLRASEGLAAAAETGLRLLRTNNLGCRRSLLLEPSPSTSGSDRQPVRTGTGASASPGPAPGSCVTRRRPSSTVHDSAREDSSRSSFATDGPCGSCNEHGTHAPVPRRAVLRAVSDGARDGLDVAAAMVVAQAAGALGYLLEMLSKRPARV